MEGIQEGLERFREKNSWKKERKNGEREESKREREVKEERKGNKDYTDNKDKKLLQNL